MPTEQWIKAMADLPWPAFTVALMSAVSVLFWRLTAAWKRVAEVEREKLAIKDEVNATLREVLPVTEMAVKLLERISSRVAKRTGSIPPSLRDPDETLR